MTSVFSLFELTTSFDNTLGIEAALLGSRPFALVKNGYNERYLGGSTFSDYEETNLLFMYDAILLQPLRCL